MFKLKLSFLMRRRNQAFHKKKKKKVDDTTFGFDRMIMLQYDVMCAICAR